MAEAPALIARDLIEPRESATSPYDVAPFRRNRVRGLPLAAALPGGESVSDSAPSGVAAQSATRSIPRALGTETGGVRHDAAAGSAVPVPPETNEQTSASSRPSTRQVAAAQTKLAALGYYGTVIDGRFGPRTEAAVRAFQRDVRLAADGRIGARMLTRLEAEVRRRTQLRQQQPNGISPMLPPSERKPPERGFFGSVLGGFQRLLGRDFDGVRRPDEITAYCRANSTTWIYDFGREAFVYCGNVVLQQPPLQSTESAVER